MHRPEFLLTQRHDTLQPTVRLGVAAGQLKTRAPLETRGHQQHVDAVSLKERERGKRERERESKKEPSVSKACRVVQFTKRGQKEKMYFEHELFARGREDFERANACRFVQSHTKRTILRDEGERKRKRKRKKRD